MGNETSIITSPCLGKLKADITKEEVSTYRKVPAGLYLRTSEMQPSCSLPTLSQGQKEDQPETFPLFCLSFAEAVEKSLRRLHVSLFPTLAGWQQRG